MRRCSRCAETKPLDEFHRDKTDKEGRGRLCKPCANTRANDWYRNYPERARAARDKYAAANREKLNADARRRYKDNPQANADAHRKLRYGITRQEYDARMRSQGGLCAICGSPPKRNGLAVDHCHDTGAVRGLLCMRCNQGMGFFRDSAEYLLAAAAYLQAPPILTV